MKNVMVSQVPNPQPAFGSEIGEDDYAVIRSNNLYKLMESNIISILSSSMFAPVPCWFSWRTVRRLCLSSFRRRKSSCLKTNPSFTSHWHPTLLVQKPQLQANDDIIIDNLKKPNAVLLICPLPPHVRFWCYASPLLQIQYPHFFSPPKLQELRLAAVYRS